MFDLNISPDQIVNYLTTMVDPKKLLLTLFQSQKGQKYISQKLGKDPQDLQLRLMDAFSSTKQSQAKRIDQRKKSQADAIQAYKMLSGQLISVDRLSQFDAVVMAAGLFGIDPQRVSEYLRSRGWDANARIIENYYNKKESWFKRFMASKGRIIPQWNDFDLSPTLQGKKDEKPLKPCPSPEQVQAEGDITADISPTLPKVRPAEKKTIETQKGNENVLHK